ncbi:MAG TPA: histidine kinase [Leucothrix mucor]|uniref:histidine kinase n=1 Tax=Leucothrix mucor TaxID=45248 RepID=A0A7V2T3X1_LEUMU|nr:histidine kinase [Leucothrix mucor]
MPSVPLKAVLETLPSWKNKGKNLSGNIAKWKTENAEVLAESSRGTSLPWLASIVLASLVFVFLVIGFVYFWSVDIGMQTNWFVPLMTVLWLFAGAGLLFLLLLLYWIWREFNRFGKDLSEWADNLLKGELSSRMQLYSTRCPSLSIRNHINCISDDYEALARVQQKRLLRQTEYIKQKKHYLSVLYEVASCINQSQNLEDLLQQFLYTLTGVVKAEAATVRLLDNNDQMRLVASIGLSDEVIAKEDVLPQPDCLCGKAAVDGNIQVRADVRMCGKLIGETFFDTDNIEMLAIPLQYRGKTLGVYNLFVRREDHREMEGEHELLISIGQHLGMAIEKASVEDDARLLSIIKERTRMAHELHDSLAQTLAILRYKIRLFDDTMNAGDESAIWEELEGLENSIDDAYLELRSLITHFRAPVDGKGVVRSVERVIERFRRDTKLEVFFYHNWELGDLSRDTEIEVVRIVQESLVNIRKHSQAETVRVLMRSSEEGECSVLIEDDGIGITDDSHQPDEAAGEHLGLSIIQERAARINGEIHFESGDGEGTLVQLAFQVTEQAATLNTPISRVFNDDKIITTQDNIL